MIKITDKQLAMFFVDNVVVVDIIPIVEEIIPIIVVQQLVEEEVNQIVLVDHIIPIAQVLDIVVEANQEQQKVEVVVVVQDAVVDNFNHILVNLEIQIQLQIANLNVHQQQRHRIFNIIHMEIVGNVVIMRQVVIKCIQIKRLILNVEH